MKKLLEDKLSLCKMTKNIERLCENCLEQSEKNCATECHKNMWVMLMAYSWMEWQNKKACEWQKYFQECGWIIVFRQKRLTTNPQELNGK